MKERIEITIGNLKKNGFTVKYFKDAESAKKTILGDVTAGQSIGFGGSVTVDRLGIYEDLKEKGCPVFWHWKSADKDERIHSLQQAAISRSRSRWAVRDQSTNFEPRNFLSQCCRNKTSTPRGRLV